MSSFAAGKLAGAVPSGLDHFEFYVYNPTDTEYNFHLAGSVGEDWADSADTFALTPKAWTKVIISAADIELNKQGQWYLYILGGDGAGATATGWQVAGVCAVKA